MRFSVSPRAVEDGIRAREWYALGPSDRSAAFDAELRRVFDRIMRFPNSGHPYLAGTRRSFLHGFPYYVVYQIRGGVLVILAVGHFRQEVGFWLERED